ncbi:MAG: hypothetical protein ABFD89_00530 [Bryobacteraceae bacterium]
MSDDVSGRSVVSAESKRYIAGPMLDVRLPLRLGVEFDALYRSFGYTSNFSSPFGYSIIRERANSWEFPLIAKYRPAMGLGKPFAGVGYSWRTVHGSRASSGRYLSSQMKYIDFTGSTDLDYSTTHGLVVAAGVDLDSKHICISPEFRYVHWNEPFLDPSGTVDDSYGIRSAQNEFFIMIGISWHEDWQSPPFYLFLWRNKALFIICV